MITAGGGWFCPSLPQSVAIPVEVCIFDNRGIGQSASPEDKRGYTTERMANEALALLDHLGWKRAHLVGHSM